MPSDPLEAIAGQPPVLLKVPKWLSDIWRGAASGTSVAEFDLRGDKLHLLSVYGKDGEKKGEDLLKGRPKSVSVVRRASPELFSFEKQIGAQIDGPAIDALVDGPVAEALHIKVDLHDDTVKGMLQSRVEGAQVTGGNRSQHDDMIRSMDERIVPQVVKGGSTTGVEAEAVFTEPPPSAEEVGIVVDRSLSKERGLTLSELLQRLPRGCTMVSIRDALVVSAEPRVSGGVCRYFASARQLQRQGQEQRGGVKRPAVANEQSGGGRSDRLKRRRSLDER